MNFSRALRPASRVLVATVVTAVTVVGFSAPSTSSAGRAPAAPAAPAAAPPGLAAVATKASPGVSTRYYERKVQAWVNVVRKRHGLRSLRLANCTDAVAERWASYLATHNAFYHQSMTRLLNKCNAYYAAETLGRGTIAPRRLVRMWMHSAPHRHVLMSKRPRRIGIGAVPNSRGEWVVAANFMKF